VMSCANNASASPAKPISANKVGLNREEGIMGVEWLGVEWLGVEWFLVTLLFAHAEKLQSPFACDRGTGLSGGADDSSLCILPG
jgi:hypothetical protein